MQKEGTENFYLCNSVGRREKKERKKKTYEYMKQAEIKPEE